MTEKNLKKAFLQELQEFLGDLALRTEVYLDKLEDGSERVIYKIVMPDGKEERTLLGPKLQIGWRKSKAKVAIITEVRA